MARFTARSHSSLKEEERARSRKKRTTGPPSSFARYAASCKMKPSPQAKQSSRSPLSFVFVGNLRSNVRNEHLEQLFARCGKVVKIDIRCCSGTAVPSDTDANTVYATVLFDSVDGATKALFKHGHRLLGKRIVVAPSFLAMPEAKRAIRRKPVSFCGFNLTKISDNIQQAVNRICTGGTQIFSTEEEY